MIKNGSSFIDKLVLNPVQREAVLYDGGPELVFAGAGTGKTRVLTAKIAYLIEKGTPPGRIFAATFTNKAAREMRSRVEGFTGMSVEGLWIGTFHSLCARILRRESRFLGYVPHFSIYDQSDQLSLIKKVLKALEVDDRSMPPRQVLGLISNHKNRCTTPEELEGRVSNYFEQQLHKIYKTYQKMLREQQSMDFDDLLSNTVYLFRDNKEVSARYQSCFDYILVDEYQDTNAAQFELLKLLSGRTRQVFAVGDDDQSIYGWRGARVENILSFENQFPETKVFKLEQNYRSTKAILDFANSAIAGNRYRTPKQLWTDRSGGEMVIVNRYRDDRQEADEVARKVNLIVNGKTKGGDVAVLFRTNAQSRSFEEAFRKHRIPYVLVGGTGFYERAEIKDCLAYLRLIVNPCDNVSFERIYNVPARGLGQKALETLFEVAGEKKCSLLDTLFSCDLSLLGSRYQKGFSDLRSLYELLREKKSDSPHEILNSVLQLSGYMDMLSSEESEESLGRIENINELSSALAAWSNENPGRNLADFLEEVSLISDVDSWERRDDAVNLMTLHCAKGLEFKYVFLVGLEDGIIPSRQNLDDEVKMEEERRLLYVGATRAMEKLECSHVDQRWRFGDLLRSSPSRFLSSIPENQYQFRDESTNFGLQPSQNRTISKPVQMVTRKPEPVKRPVFDEFSQETVEFRMGQHVKHKIYGRGKILGISGFGDDMKLTVLFNDGARRKLMAKFANFESV
ncbi:MAG TPA: UvrD-helicase domain-containing protein [Chitinispirillaceae bacterium]|nr:UvrD-helicase domain-containing protein [Chitinispirillaceae bacterium]